MTYDDVHSHNPTEIELG